MFRERISIALGLLPLVRATALQVPIFSPDFGPSLGKEELFEAGEEPLRSKSSTSINEPAFSLPDPHVVPIITFENMEYFASITVGTPAQPFRALVDISWSDLLVPSIACKNKRFGVCNGHYAYHPSWSRTHVQMDKELHNQNFPGLFYNAIVSRDVFSIAGIEIPDQDFLEATYVFTDPLLLFADGMDAILGLAPDASTSSANLVGPLTNMLNRGLLDRNIVSIMLGRKVWDDVDGARLINGELMFGGINEDLLQPNTTMKFLSMSNKTDAPDTPYPRPLCNGTWQVTAQAVSMTWFNETSGENQTERVDLADTWTARLDTVQMFVTVPERIDTILTKLADPMRIPYFYPFIDCRDRARLPNLVFTLGAGHEAHEFELTPYDYTLESDVLGLAGQCLWAVSRGYNEYDESEVLELGSAFMRAFYVALDSDSRKIGLGTPSISR